MLILPIVLGCNAPKSSDPLVGYVRHVRPSLSGWEAEKIVLAVRVAVKRYHLNPLPEHGPDCSHVRLVLACIETESEFRVGVPGDDGNSLGLMQVQWKYRRHIPKERLRLDTSLNIREGVKYLRQVGWDPAAYNAGPRGAQKGKGKHHAKKVSRAEERISTWLTGTR